MFGGKISRGNTWQSRHTVPGTHSGPTAGSLVRHPKGRLIGDPGNSCWIRTSACSPLAFPTVWMFPSASR